MATPSRHAFAPLSSFIEASSLSDRVQDRATSLFNSARTKTARGSGNELPTVLSGNATAVAAACLMFAQTEINGSSSVEQDDYQRQSGFTKTLFKKLVTHLQGVLELRGAAAESATKKTPTRSSARKRDADAAKLEEDDDDPAKTTPTKSARTSSRAVTVSASRSTKVSTTPTRSGRSSRVQELASGRASSSAKQRLEDDMDEHVGSTSTGSPSRRSTRASGSATVVASTSKSVSPSKAAATTPKKKVKSGSKPDDAAFQAAMSAKTVTTPTKSATSAATKKAKPMAVPVLPEPQEEEDEEQDLPYEPYRDDLLRMWRTKVDGRDKEGKRVKVSFWESMKEETEVWKNDMLDMLDVADLVA